MKYREFKDFVTGKTIRQTTSYSRCEEEELRDMPTEKQVYTVKHCTKNRDRDYGNYAKLLVMQDGITEDWYIPRYMAEILFFKHIYVRCNNNHVTFTYEII